MPFNNDSRLGLARKSANIFIYASVILGVLLLFQLYSIVPGWLFYSVSVGWIAYVTVAILVAKHKETAYLPAIVLAILTILVSLPQPEHQNMVSTGFSIGTITFLAGSILQLGVILSIIYYYVRKRSMSVQYAH